MKIKILLSIFLLFILGCNPNKVESVNLLNGYWEILKVKKDRKLIKEYGISPTVDYFEITDSLTGFRKKVAPRLDGKFIVNDDQVNFTLKLENDSLNIYYNQNDVLTKEIILKLDNEELIIANSQGFQYFYKPFKAINLGHE
ncbi:hypothetical protein U0L90_07095 [Flavobacteriaceae sp. LMIT009]